MANSATPLMFDLAAAFGAGSFKQSSLFHLLRMTGRREMISYGLGYGIGAGKNLVFTEARMGMAGNIQELLDDLDRLNPAPPGKGNHPPDGLALRCGTAAAFPMVVNSSNNPSSSSLMVTYRGPQPVCIR